MTLFQTAYEIYERILKEQPFEKYMSEDKKTLYLEFQEHDLPSVTFAFDKETFNSIKKIISYAKQYS